METLVNRSKKKRNFTALLSIYSKFFIILLGVENWPLWKTYDNMAVFPSKWFPTLDRSQKAKNGLLAQNGFLRVLLIVPLNEPI